MLKAINSKKYIDKEIGIFRGFKVIPTDINLLINNPKIILKGKVTHTIELSSSDTGSIQKIENYLGRLESKLEEYKNTLEKEKQQIEVIKDYLNTPFEQKEELDKAIDELNTVNNELEIGKEDSNIFINESYEEKEVYTEEIFEETEEDFECEIR